MPKVSAARREQVRQHLLDAARTVISRDGPEAATTRAILAEAGMAIGSLYTYFSGKEELFAELAEQTIAENVALFKASGPRRRERQPASRSASSATCSPRPDDSPALTYFRGRHDVRTPRCATPSAASTATWSARSRR